MILLISLVICRRTSRSSARTLMSAGCLSPKREERSASRRITSVSCARSCAISGDCTTSGATASILPLFAASCTWRSFASLAARSAAAVISSVLSWASCWVVTVVPRMSEATILFCSRNCCTACSAACTVCRRSCTRSLSHWFARRVASNFASSCETR